MGKDCGIQKQAILLARGEFDKRGAVPYASAVVSSNNALLGFSDPSTVQRKPFSGRHWVVLEDEKNKTPCEHEENLRTLSRVSHVSLPWRVAGVNNLTTHEVDGSLDSAAGRCINGSRGMCLPSSFAVCSSRNNIRVARHLNQFSYQCD